MFIQHVLKGISGLTDHTLVEEMVHTRGIVCNWWHRVNVISPKDVSDQLTEAALYNHLTHYDDVDPYLSSVIGKDITYGQNSPFISTTAGTVERDTFYRRNLIFPPLMTALRFATANFTATGYVFYAYLFVLGKPAVELSEFAEETRDLHQYTVFQPYHHEGELVAKIHIPSERIERAERYEPGQTLNDLISGIRPKPTQVTSINPRYQSPDRFHNIRHLLV